MFFRPPLTWDQALFSFRFENYIPAGKAKRKELERMCENRSNWAWSQVRPPLVVFGQLVFVVVLVYRTVYVSGKLPTYPFPESTFCPKWEVSANVGFGEA